jgi:EAL domain-containing protein (putative c-di-GMP-specific phosphodiesterase class I)
MQNLEAGVLVMRSLHDLGIRLAIDDFGTGYSSLSYLRYLPIDKIKIDRSFLSEMASDRRAARLVNGIISLAKSLNLTTVAEGVETENQLQMLRRYGCDLAQGYLFSRPLPAAEFASLIRGRTPLTGPGRAQDVTAVNVNATYS